MYHMTSKTSKMKLCLGMHTFVLKTIQKRKGMRKYSDGLWSREGHTGNVHVVDMLCFLTWVLGSQMFI